MLLILKVGDRSANSKNFTSFGSGAVIGGKDRFQAVSGVGLVAIQNAFDSLCDLV